MMGGAIALLLSFCVGGSLAYAFIKEEQQQIRQQREQLRGGVSEPSPWGDVYDVPVKPSFSGVSAIESAAESPLKLAESASESSLKLAETGDGFPRYDRIEMCFVGKYDPSAGGLNGVDGEFVEWCFLRQQGLNQLAIIWRMWGAKQGGSKRYIAARKRHDLYLKWEQQAQTTELNETDEHSD